MGSPHGADCFDLGPSVRPSLSLSLPYRPLRFLLSSILDCALMRVPRAGDPVQVRQLLRRSGEGRVVATCRAPGSAAELQKLKEEHAPGRLTVLPLDVTDESTIEVRRTRIAFQFWSAMLQPWFFLLLLESSQRKCS